jgi:hypothetical protein
MWGRRPRLPTGAKRRHPFACPPMATFLREDYMGKTMLLALFFVLLVLWLLGFFAFHVAGGLIHLLIVVAVIVLIAHLFTGRRVV